MAAETQVSAESDSVQNTWTTDSGYSLVLVTLTPGVAANVITAAGKSDAKFIGSDKSCFWRTRSAWLQGSGPSPKTESQCGGLRRQRSRIHRKCRQGF